MKQIRPLHLLAKTLIIFVLANLIFALWNPPVGRLSLYNLVFPGRTRFPFATGPRTVTIDNLDAMFASHVISAPKRKDEFRVIILGDSAMWGDGLYDNETISAQLNKLQFDCPGKELRFYNLGFPHMSIVKDILILNKAMKYQPDLIIWAFTLSTVQPKEPNAFLLENLDQILALQDKYALKETYASITREKTTLLDKTFIGQRRELARLILLQSLGTIWSATGSDASLNSNVTIESNTDAEDESVSNDVKDSIKFLGMNEPGDISPFLLLDYFGAGDSISGDVPILYVNAPMFIATGKNSDLRYNASYPRWAYDQYRQIISEHATANQWNYLDLWNVIPPADFIGSQFHLSAEGQQLLAGYLKPAIQQSACQ
jgi:hypothetical protein